MNAGQLVIRPIRAQDAAAFRAFVEDMSPATRYERFQYTVKEVSPALLRLLVEADPRSHVALAAFWEGKVVGEARYVREGDGAQFAIAVADGWRRRGVASRLLEDLLAHARGNGVRRLHGEVLAWNQAMLDFAGQAGFRVGAHPEEERLLRVELPLGQGRA